MWSQLGSTVGNSVLTPALRDPMSSLSPQAPALTRPHPTLEILMLVIDSHLCFIIIKHMHLLFLYALLFKTYAFIEHLFYIWPPGFKTIIL